MKHNKAWILMQKSQRLMRKIKVKMFEYQLKVAPQQI